MLTFRSPQSRFWLVFFIIFLITIWALQPMLLPFVAGMVIAYFLNPIVNRFSRMNIPRWVSTSLALLIFVLTVALILVLIVPLVQGQVSSFIQALPNYITTFKQNVIPWAERIASRLTPNGAEQLQTAAQQYAVDAVSWLGSIIQKLISGSMAIFDVLTLLIVTPVVAFYLLRDWPKVTRTIDQLIPRQHYDDIKIQLHEIDKALSGFIRGQALVCLSLGLMYGGGLSFTGLNYGVTIGVIAGVLSFIPYVGTTFGWVVSLLLALLQFNTAWEVGAVMSVFVVGQIVESYFLTPKLVGDRVGLHPVWIMFALFAGGTLMGFVGVLIAVPVAAVLGVLVRHGIRKYKHSVVYDPAWPAEVSAEITSAPISVAPPLSKWV